MKRRDAEAQGRPKHVYSVSTQNSLNRIWTITEIS